ncbi:hypothetical protein Tco_0073002 [Tanacetum coccineum]
MEESNSFLALEDDPTSSEVDPTYQDPEGDILLLEAILNSEPPPPLPNHEQYMPGGRKELKLCEAKTVESSVNELLSRFELKDLPPHSWTAITWILSDIKGVSPEFFDSPKFYGRRTNEPSVKVREDENEPDYLLDGHGMASMYWITENSMNPPEKTTSLYHHDQMLERTSRKQYYWFPRRLSRVTFKSPLTQKIKKRRTLHNAHDGTYLPIVAAFWAMQCSWHVPKMYDGNLPHMN